MVSVSITKNIFYFQYTVAFYTVVGELQLKPMDQVWWTKTRSQIAIN